MIRSKLSSLREYLTPIDNKSNFSKTGEISPDEFVKAGDYLVYKFPTWEWSSAPPKLTKDFLPKDKQFLVTKHVPSYQRAHSYLGVNDANLDEDEEELEDGWIKSHRINTDDDNNNAQLEGNHHDKQQEEEIDELIDDTNDLELEDNQDLDEGFEDLIESNENNNLRKYDLFITYSTSYRVPKLYLVGFNSNGIPLLPKQMFEDIASDYRDKTATIENLPVSFNTTSVSIHPCKHSSVMKVLMQHAIEAKKRRQNNHDDNDNDKIYKDDYDDDDDNNNDNGESQQESAGIRVDQYLIIFLKFIASVTPGIEYDYTMEVL